MFTCMSSAGATSVVPSTSLCELIRLDAADKDVLDHIKNYPNTLNDCDRNKKTALMAAIEDERIIIITALLASKVDLELEDIEGWRALHYACNAGVPDIVQVLLDKHPQVNAIAGKSGLTPLHLASGDALTEIVCIMRESSADNKIQDAFGRTPAEYWKLVKKEGETSVSSASTKIMQANRQKSIAPDTELYKTVFKDDNQMVAENPEISKDETLQKFDYH